MKKYNMEIVKDFIGIDGTATCPECDKEATTENLGQYYHKQRGKKLEKTPYYQCDCPCGCRYLVEYED